MYTQRQLEDGGISIMRTGADVDALLLRCLRSFSLREEA